MGLFKLNSRDDGRHYDDITDYDCNGVDDDNSESWHSYCNKHKSDC